MVKSKQIPVLFVLLVRNLNDLAARVIKSTGVSAASIGWLYSQIAVSVKKSGVR